MNENKKVFLSGRVATGRFYTSIFFLFRPKLLRIVIDCFFNKRDRRGRQVFDRKHLVQELWWVAYHGGSIRASHPAAPGSNPGSADFFLSLLVSSWTV